MHTGTGSTCWSMPLPWLLASQAKPGSQPSSWSVQLFQEAPREGEGPVTMSIAAFSSCPLGKREKDMPSLGAHLPIVAQEPELPQARGHRSLPTKTGSGHIPHLPGTPKPPRPGKCQAAHSTLRHTTREDGGSGTTPVPRETFLCHCTILPAPSQRAHWLKERRNTQSVPLWGHLARRNTCILCRQHTAELPACRAGVGDKAGQSD